MKFTKRILALCLVLATMLSMVPFAFMEASALEGAGAPTDLTYYSLGIDISEYQPNVDFAALKASGCEYVILRVHNGNGRYDYVFESHYKAARAAGMKLGVYMFTYATTYAQAQSEAQMLINYFEANDMYFEHPIWYDIESSSQFNLSSANKEALCLGWCETLEAAGYYPGIYSGLAFFNGLSSNFKYDKWIAYYASNDMYATQYTYLSAPYGGSRFNAQGYSMWQYSYYNYTPSTNSYLFRGVTTSAGGTTPVQQLDLDVCYKDYPSIIETNGLNNCQTNEKAMLEKVVKKAEEEKCIDYDDDGITTLRDAYDKAVAVLAKSSATDAEYRSARVALESALENVINNVVSSSVISVGKDYEAKAGTRGDIFDDDSIRLTDGKKQSADPGTSAYSGWYKDTQIVVDLVSAQPSNSYVVYLAGGPYGITVPVDGEFTVRIYASTNGTDFDLVATSSDVEAAGTYGTSWTLQTVTINVNSEVNARYIKFDITCDTDYGYIWLDEVEVGYRVLEKSTEKVYVTGINEYIVAGACSIFTPDFGSISINTANHAFTANLIAVWDEELEAYVVKSVDEGEGLTTAPITLAENEILVAAHCWEENADVPVPGSALNFNTVITAEVGDIIRLNGIDLATKTTTAVPYLTIESAHKHIPGDEATCTENQTCSGCGEVITEALGHDEGEVVDGKCDRCGEPLENKEDPDNNGWILGDVNKSGAIDMMDYVLLKRNYFGTFVFDEDQLKRGDVNKSGEIDMMDYILLKRAYFGTFVLE